METVCLAAILKYEEPFLDEWIVYHWMLGIDHFYLYDDNPDFPLRDFLKPYKEFVTVVNWYKSSPDGKRENQFFAYRHALKNYCFSYDWVVFIDGDEFITLRKHEDIKSFLKDYADYSAVSLDWHVFGHNGYFENPEGFITSSLTRRMYLPGRDVKTFSRPQAIETINSPHFFRYKNGHLHVDVNKRIFQEKKYPGRTDIANINHYMCRSFKNWMNRVNRGDSLFITKDYPDIHKWRFSEEECLKEFVGNIALYCNEYVDDYMLKYKEEIESRIMAYRMM